MNQLSLNSLESKESQAKRRLAYDELWETHETAKQFELCAECNINFSDESSLKKHYKDVHKGAKFFTDLNSRQQKSAVKELLKPGRTFEVSSRVHCSCKYPKNSNLIEYENVALHALKAGHIALTECKRCYTHTVTFLKDAHRRICCN